MLTMEYDEVLAKKIEREEGREEGIEIGREEGMEIGREEGMEIGERKAEENFVIGMLNDGVDVRLIQRYTNLSLERIEEIKKKMK